MADYVSVLPTEILQKAKEELGEDDFLRQQSLDSIRQWLKKQPHLKAFPADGLFLLAFNYFSLKWVLAMGRTFM